MTRAGMIAALYAALTLLLHPISYGPVQFRAAEALTLLPLLTFDAVPGLFVGCLVANLLGGAPWYDIVFGSLATLMAASLTWKFRRNRPFAAAMPVLFNAFIVGPVVYMAYSKAPGGPFSLPLLLKDICTVGIGEAVVVFVLGFVLIRALKKVFA